MGCARKANLLIARGMHARVLRLLQRKRRGGQQSDRDEVPLRGRLAEQRHLLLLRQARKAGRDAPRRRLRDERRPAGHRHALHLRRLRARGEAVRTDTLRRQRLTKQRRLRHAGADRSTVIHVPRLGRLRLLRETPRGLAALQGDRGVRTGIAVAHAREVRQDGEPRQHRIGGPGVREI